MRNINIKELLKNRKTLYLTLTIILISVLSLTIVYAALSTVLNITGSSEITASNWDIHLANPSVSSGSVNNNLPTINGNNLSFNATLSLPGDYYEFTVDVVNDGTIDAMIDSIVKTPELTSDQAKYIKYEITYQNGESINTNQTIKSKSKTPIKIRIEYRRDISASALPSQENNLTLKLTLIYVQSDGSGSSIPNNGAKLISIISGDGTQVGNEVCIAEECFYTISSNDTSITMLSKYNLNVGSIYTNDYATAIVNPTGRQDSEMIGYFPNYTNTDILKGVTIFAETNYWYNNGLKEEYGTSYPTYVYDSNSRVYNYVENYRMYFESLGITLDDARLITLAELENLGCDTSTFSKKCNSTPDWVFSTTYWTGEAYDFDYVWAVRTDRVVSGFSGLNIALYGVRPVITISKDYF